MGYYTQHNLEVRNVSSEEKFMSLQDELKKGVKGYGIIGYALDDGYYHAAQHTADFCSCCECKWYESSEDMKKISETFPEMIFRLSGEGEATGDLWEAYYQNGDEEMCRAEIVYPKPERIKWEG